MDKVTGNSSNCPATATTAERESQSLRDSNAGWNEWNVLLDEGIGAYC